MTEVIWSTTYNASTKEFLISLREEVLRDFVVNTIEYSESHMSSICYHHAEWKVDGLYQGVMLGKITQSLECIKGFGKFPEWPDTWEGIVPDKGATEVEWLVKETKAILPHAGLFEPLSDMELVSLQHLARQYPEDEEFVNEILIELGYREKSKNVREELETDSLEEGPRA